MRAVNVAVLGATGAVGQEMLQILAERQFPIKSLKLLASPRSAGRKVEFNNQEYVIEAVSAEQFADVDIAFLPLAVMPVSSGLQWRLKLDVQLLTTRVLFA